MVIFSCSVLVMSRRASVKLGGGCHGNTRSSYAATHSLTAAYDKKRYPAVPKGLQTPPPWVGVDSDEYRADTSGTEGPRLRRRGAVPTKPPSSETLHGLPDWEQEAAHPSHLRD